VIKLSDGGPPVGLLEDAIYETGRVLVPDGSTVLMDTDSVVEARNPEDEEFGLVRLIDVCRRSYQDIDTLSATIMEVLRPWRGEREQGDDIYSHGACDQRQ
jgi:sigma-B regulation protein RsbU (phosphoserine phosphatase)